jgi:hypothetical protein
MEFGPHLKHSSGCHGALPAASGQWRKLKWSHPRRPAASPFWPRARRALNRAGCRAPATGAGGRAAPWLSQPHQLTTPQTASWAVLWERLSLDGTPPSQLATGVRHAAGACLVMRTGASAGTTPAWLARDARAHERRLHLGVATVRGLETLAFCFVQSRPHSHSHAEAPARLKGLGAAHRQHVRPSGLHADVHGAVVLGRGCRAAGQVAAAAERAGATWAAGVGGRCGSAPAEGSRVKSHVNNFVSYGSWVRLRGTRVRSIFWNVSCLLAI